MVNEKFKLSLLEGSEKIDWSEVEEMPTYYLERLYEACGKLEHENKLLHILISQIRDFKHKCPELLDAARNSFGETIYISLLNKSEVDRIKFFNYYPDIIRYIVNYDLLFKIDK